MPTLLNSSCSRYELVALPGETILPTGRHLSLGVLYDRSVLCFVGERR